MKREDWRPWRLSLTLAAGLAVAAGALYGYSGYFLHRERQGLAAAEESMADLEARPMPDALDATTLTRAQAALPPTPEIPQWIQAFRRSAEKAGLAWVRLQQGTEEGGEEGGKADGTKKEEGSDSSPVAAVPFVVNVKGTYPQLFQLFKEIEGWPRLVSASGWTLDLAQGTGHLSLVSYYLPGQADRPAGPVETYSPAGKADPTR